MQPNIVPILLVVISVSFQIWVNADDALFHIRYPHRTPDTRIIDGKPVKPHSVPYIVALTMLDPTTGEYLLCGGTLISDRHVLTAAHCVHGNVVVMLQFGAHNRSIAEPDQKIIFGESNFKYIEHRDYNPRISSHDIAIIKLLTPLDVNHTKYVEVARLIEDQNANDNFLNEIVEAYGWGWINDDPVERAKELMGVNLTVIDLSTCYRQMRKAAYPSDVDLYTYEICTNGHGPNGSIGGCHGDSGGPLVYNGTVIGVVSRGATGRCTREEPTVFVSVGQHLNWIRDRIANF